MPKLVVYRVESEILNNMVGTNFIECIAEVEISQNMKRKRVPSINFRHSTGYGRFANVFLQTSVEQKSQKNYAASSQKKKHSLIQVWLISFIVKKWAIEITHEGEMNWLQFLYRIMPKHQPLFFLKVKCGILIAVQHSHSYVSITGNHR